MHYEPTSCNPSAHAVHSVMLLAVQLEQDKEHPRQVPAGVTTNPLRHDVQVLSLEQTRQFLEQSMHCPAPLLKYCPGKHERQEFALPLQVMQDELQGKHEVPLRYIPL